MLKKLLFFLLVSTANLHAATDGLHNPFTGVLAAHVNNGVVDYAGIKSDPRFYRYLDTIAAINPESFNSDTERLAFWINAYNALAIKGIIDGHSPSTFFGRIGYFKTVDFQAGGRTMSLHELEHEVIIPFAEPRIHFAIVCASQSCPKLRSEAFIAARLDEQLADNTREFLNDSSKNSFDRQQKVARLSRIFDWFEKDFRAAAGSVQGFIAPYLADRELAADLGQNDYRIRHLKYDWSLNGIPAN